MNQNEVLAMLHDIIAGNQQYTTWTVSTPHLVMLVNKAVEADVYKYMAALIYGRAEEDITAAIRARGQK